MYEPSLSICLSSLVLWKLISSRSCSSMVGGLARPDDELLARVAMPSGCSRGSRGAIPPRVPAVCRHDHNRQRIHAHRVCVCVCVRRASRRARFVESRLAERRVRAVRNDRGHREPATTIGIASLLLLIPALLADRSPRMPSPARFYLSCPRGASVARRREGSC